MDRLKGKIILISGGARGQGAAEARLFVTEGARVIIGDVLEPEGRQLASELGHAAAFVRQDVTQERDWETAVNAAEKLGGLHGLVNNAGIYLEPAGGAFEKGAAQPGMAFEHAAGGHAGDRTH